MTLAKDLNRVLPIGDVGDVKVDVSPIENYVLLPGFCDVHVHFREPGFSYKGTIKDGSLAAAKGGYTAVCTMPNLNPAPDCVDTLRIQQEIIDRDSVIKIYPYGTITKGEQGKELSDMEGLKNAGAVAFSDDGRGVQNGDVMEEAMKKAKSLDMIIAAHCEVNELLKGGYIHDGIYAKTHNHKGICSASEYEQISRDVSLAAKTGCAYHVCHVSTKESVEIIRQAKKDGVNVTCETAPHYLVLDENDLMEEGRFKMNPPLRSTEDRLALIEGIKDGTIDIIATDHAPHSAEEKSKGLKDSPFGIVGLETAFPILYTYLVKKNVISLEKLVELLAINPRKRFNIPFDNGFSVWEIATEYEINSADFVSKGKATPFDGYKVFGRNVMTYLDGKTIYKSNF